MNNKASGTKPAGTATFSYMNKRLELPVLSGTEGPNVVDIRKLYGEADLFTYDPGFTSTASCESDLTFIDVDKGILVMTGNRLRLVTQRETITARDTLEYWQQQDMAVARGNALAVSEQKKIAADLLTAYFTKRDDAKGAKSPARTTAAADKAPGADSDLDRMYAYGNVVVTTPQEIAHGNRGVYNARTGIAVLTGAVKITRDQNQLNGDAAEMNFNTNISRIIAAPGGSGGSGGGSPPVRALLVPKDKDASGQEGTR